MTIEQIFVDLTIIFIAAKLAGWVFEKIHQPAVIGELLIGIVIGPHALGLTGMSHTHEVFQEFGAVILLFVVGLDTPLSELRAVGGRSTAVGILGIVLPFAAGTALLLGLGHGGNESLFMGTAMVATSVGVTARVLSDLGRVKTEEARVILGAAVVDDILGLLVLAVVAGSVEGSVSAGSVIFLALLSVGFVALVGGLGPRLIARLRPLLDRLGERGIFGFSLGLCLVLASSAAELGLAAIIGAFLAGMSLAETRDRYHLESHLNPIYALMVPFFFVITGSRVDLSVFADGGTAALAGGVIAVAVFGKLIGCGAAAWTMGRKSALIIGVGMVPRGEVGILVGTLGLQRGIIETDVYAIVVAMSVLTTLIAPPILAALYGSPGYQPRGPRDAGIQGLD